MPQTMPRRVLRCRKASLRTKQDLGDPATMPPVKTVTPLVPAVSVFHAELKRVVDPDAL